MNLFSGYVYNNMANLAIDLFNKTDKPDEILLNLLFNACAQLRTTEALHLVKKVSKEMAKSFYSNPRLLTSLLDALIKCDDIKEVESLFNSTTNKTSSMYGVMMNGYNKDNNPIKTLNLYNQMKKDLIEGDIIIYLLVIKAASQMGDYSICQAIVKEIPDRFRFDNQICNALIDMWVSVKNLELVFDLKNTIGGEKWSYQSSK